MSSNARFMGTTDELIRANSMPKKARKIGEVLISMRRIPKIILTNFGTTNKGK